jgi:hypothetical protein
VENANNLKYNEPAADDEEDEDAPTTSGVGNTEFRFSGLQGGIVFFDWLYAYGFVGQGWMINEAMMKGQSIKLESNKDLVGGAGASAVLYTLPVDESNIFRIGLDVKTRRIALGTDTALIDGEKVRGVDYFMSVREYQAALGVSWQIDNFIPYTGIINTIVPYTGFKISKSSGDVRFHYEDNRYNRKVKPSAEEVGQFAGISFNFNNAMSLNLESRFKDEEALGIQILVRF